MSQIAELSKEPLVIGLNQTKKALQRGQVAILYIAQDADRRLTAPLEALAGENEITVETAATMRELGKRFGIDVGAAVGAVLKK